LPIRAVNRAKLLLAYLRRQSRVNALPVEFIVETTAKCNIYCPMCPRETHKQPKEDMADAIFQRLVQDAGNSAEHMMLIGLGEPLLDPKIYERIEYCEGHGIYTLLSTNGTLLDEKAAERLLASPLQHITLSFDGSTKESFEFYRKGARFEKVRDNFVRFARMKKERGSKGTRLESTGRRSDGPDGEQLERSRRFHALLAIRPRRRSGSDQIRRNKPDAAQRRTRIQRVEAPMPLPLARTDVREAERRRLSLLPELHA
jgi:organic radical activating enzyme